MLASRREYPCQTIEMSPGDIFLFAPVKPRIDETVVVHLYELGRMSGAVTRHETIGFEMTFHLPLAKRESLADRLTWHANRHILELPDNRASERLVPLRQRAMLRLSNGHEHIVKIRDFSISSVGIETNVRPALGEPIFVGDTPATVVRHFDNGIAAGFTHPFTHEEIDEAMRL
jgi:hypothetical protein